MTTYISSEFNSSINPEFGSVYLAQHSISGSKDYVLYCSEIENEKFVYLKSGTVVPAHMFLKESELINHIDEVVFKY